MSQAFGKPPDFSLQTPLTCFSKLQRALVLGIHELPCTWSPLVGEASSKHQSLLKVKRQFLKLIFSSQQAHLLYFKVLRCDIWGEIRQRKLGAAPL